MRLRVVLKQNPTGRLDWGNEWLWEVQYLSEGKDWSFWHPAVEGCAHDEGEARTRATLAAERLRSPAVIEELP